MSYTFTEGKYRAFVRTDFAEVGSSLPTKYVNGRKYEFEKEESILVPWATATDAQIAKMINAFYSNEITLTDVRSVWSVGDTRTITLNAIAASTLPTKAQPSQMIECTILDFEHDTLSTSLNGHTKALISVGQDNLFSIGDIINISDSCVGSWKSSVRRAWCNGLCLRAFENSFRTMIKQVQKQTWDNSTQQMTITDDYIWLMSQYELIGRVRLAHANEGTPYTYRNVYKSGSNVYNQVYWNRSPVVGADIGWCFMNGVTGIENYSNDARGNQGININFCL